MTKYFAKLGLNSKVVGHTHVRDEDAPTEKAGIKYLHKLHNYPFWIQTFKNGSQRKHFAGKGMIYDEDRDAFIHPQPYPSWTFNETTCNWEPPVPQPRTANQGQLEPYDPEGNDTPDVYKWNEETKKWDIVE